MMTDGRAGADTVPGTDPKPGTDPVVDPPAPPGALARLADADLSRMLLIRHFEQALLDLFAAGAVSGTAHTCIGQEYVPVALAALTEGDYVFSNHRGHGHYLSRYQDPAPLLAEILGRDGGICQGVGGSQHVFREDGFLSTGVQGESVPVAAGMALHLRRTEPGRLAVAFIGDGTWGEGAVYEGLNMAALWRLPLLVVVEHNGIAQSTPTGRQLAGTIAGRAAAFGIEHHLLDTDDVVAIRARLAPVIAAMRRDPAPVVVEFRTRRLGPHSKGDDTRTPAELSRLREQDWAHRYASQFPEQYAALDAAAGERIAALVRQVTAWPPAAWPAPAGEPEPAGAVVAR